MDTTYFLVARALRWEQKIERSLFIGDTCVVTSSEEAQAVVNQIKEEHPQANHHCYAYRIGLGNYPTTYYSDQGEPSGTTGQPILNALLHEELTNTIVVVTRYFGGKIRNQGFNRCLSFHCPPDFKACRKEAVGSFFYLAD